MLYSVREPSTKEARGRYYQHVGKGCCSVADSWWLTEIGGVLVSVLAGITPNVPARVGPSKFRSGKCAASCVRSPGVKPAS
ncbi:hypothetical protein GCM10022407_17980 [Hymenobacter antarcticus]|uniref:Uncharacterized protein n=1 Tax=Hymenobacter antarcticus TaxID=486270 RepID=A0ABP7PXB2_9BACT